MALQLSTRLPLADGNSIPILGLGTWQAQGLDVEKAVYHAIGIGYRHIDTATIYGNEVNVGNAIKKAMKDFNLKRSDLFVTTKIWNSDHKDPRAALDASLKRLQLDYVDLYLIHWPTKERKETWNAFIKLQKENKIKSIGVSNFTVQHLKDLFKTTTIKPVVNQIEIHPLLTQNDVVAFCHENQILVEAYSPLMRGQNLNDKTLKAIAQKHDKSVAQVILRWCVQRGLVPLPKSTHPSRIEENKDIFDFELTAEELNTISGLDHDKHYCWDPTTD